jgi:hypothetical protein
MEAVSSIHPARVSRCRARTKEVTLTSEEKATNSSAESEDPEPVAFGFGLRDCRRARSEWEKGVAVFVSAEVCHLVILRGRNVERWGPAKPRW